MTLRMKSVSNAPILLMVLSSCCCFLVFHAPSAAAAPYQMLIPRPGYIPVYIRLGDTPLEDIDPQLAAAFNEIEVGSSMLENVSNSNEIIVEASKQTNNEKSAAEIEKNQQQPIVVVVIPTEATTKQTNVHIYVHNKSNEVQHAAVGKRIAERESDASSSAAVNASNEIEKKK